MMNRVLPTLFLTAALVPGVTLACESNKPQVATVSTAEGARLVQSKAATFVDVNGDDTRASSGVIPGAVLLTSTEFAAGELPAEKSTKLVFYCANTQCSASRMAAKRAQEQGYGNVSILPEGIQGWKAAGNTTAPYPAKAES